MVFHIATTINERLQTAFYRDQWPLALCFKIRIKGLALRPRNA
jgi:hypothetical protein